MLKKFSKEYPLIILASIISCVIIACYIIFKNETDKYTIFELFFQLAIGIIINSLFFFTQIYLAHKKQCEYANKCIVVRINKILKGMKEIFNRLKDLYLNKEEINLTDEEQLMILLQRTCSEDYVNLIDPLKYGRENIAKFTVKEFIINRVTYIENEIEKLCTYYSNYISPDLMEVLELILNSTMHNTLARGILQFNTVIRFENLNHYSFYEPYFELIDKLEKIEKQYE